MGAKEGRWEGEKSRICTTLALLGLRPRRKREDGVKFATSSREEKERGGGREEKKFFICGLVAGGLGGWHCQIPPFLLSALPIWVLPLSPSPPSPRGDL